jgi:flavin reductase (DIM6/NTAB) family NADH-FMN oxidoreductase RutF
MGGEGYRSGTFARAHRRLPRHPWSCINLSNHEHASLRVQPAARGPRGLARPRGIGETPFEQAPPPEALEIEGDDPRIALRRTLGLFATGVTIITTRLGEQVHGMTANAFLLVPLEPPLVLISVDRRTKMCGVLHEGSTHGVSVLCECQSALSDRFAGRAGADGAEPRFELIHDTPLVEGALAGFVARVVRSYWGGDHSLFLGRVEYAHTGEGTPLLFHGGRYERLGSTAGA